jgi:hypothetical protein
MTLIQRLLGGVLAVLFLLAVLVFASLALGVLLAVGLVAWSLMWWRWRSLRKGRVIEGEYQRLEERDPQRL